jgi:hypothetical protein
MYTKREPDSDTGVTCIRSPAQYNIASEDLTSVTAGATGQIKYIALYLSNFNHNSCLNLDSEKVYSFCLFVTFCR